MNRDVLFGTCVVGIYACYLYYGILQEKITKTKYGEEEEQFKSTLGLVWIQVCFNAAVGAAMWTYFGRNKKDVTPWQDYSISSFSYIAAMFCSNFSLNYVDYPTQVLAKCCKPIPVILVGILMGKPQRMYKYLCVLTVTAGISIFMMNREMKASTKATSVYGICLLLGSLFFDGFTGNMQDKSMKIHKPQWYHMMTFTNVISLGYLTVAVAATGEVAAVTGFVSRHPSILVDFVGFGVTSALGQVFIFRTLENFGPLVLTTTTTTRKFFTILASILVYRHPLNAFQWVGVVAVFAGLGVDIYISKYLPAYSNLDTKKQDTHRSA